MAKLLVIIIALLTGTMACADPTSEVLSKTAGACKGCQVGEFAVAAKQQVAHGDYVLEPNPPCEATYKGRVKDMLDALLAAKSPKLAPFAGPLTTKIAEFIEAGARQQVRGAVAKLLDPIIGQKTATCYPLAVKVPKGSTGIRHEWRARGAHGEIANCGNPDPQQCPCDRDTAECRVCNSDTGDCSIGWSRWRSFQYEKSTGLATGLFANWSHDREREAELIVYFIPPKGWKP